jgi:hypothetical protein
MATRKGVGEMSNKTILGGVGAGEELTLEERRRRFEERKAKLFAKAKSRGVVIAVDAQTAENARARPESIRIATRDESGVTRVSGPRRYSVDAGGSSAVGWIAWGHGHSSPGLWFTPDDVPDVRHRYNPLDASVSPNSRISW